MKGKTINFRYTVCRIGVWGGKAGPWILHNGEVITDETPFDSVSEATKKLMEIGDKNLQVFVILDCLHFTDGTKESLISDKTFTAVKPRYF